MFSGSWTFFTERWWNKNASIYFIDFSLCHCNLHPSDVIWTSWKHINHSGGLAPPTHEELYLPVPEQHGRQWPVDTAAPTSGSLQGTQTNTNCTFFFFFMNRFWGNMPPEYDTNVLVLLLYLWLNIFISSFIYFYFVFFIIICLHVYSWLMSSSGKIIQCINFIL